MQEGQKAIYFLAGDNTKSMKNNPLIVKLEKRG